MLSKISNKFPQQQLTLKSNKSDIYLNGKLVPPTETIESAKIKPNDKLACIMFGYDIKTFKRFRKVHDRDESWSMNNGGEDGITFVPSKELLVMGFGSYCTRQGQPFTIGYDIYINEVPKKRGTAVCNKTGDEEVKQILFDCPILVSADTKISIVVSYISYDASSFIFIGVEGDNYAIIESNEPGLFKVEECSLPRNTRGGLYAGEIPELYYAMNE